MRTRLSLLALLLSAPLSAQDPRPPIDLPDPAPAPVEPSEEPEPEPGPPFVSFWGEPTDLAAIAFQRMERVRSLDDGLAQAAFEELRGLGPGIRPTTLHALTSRHAPTVELAARLLASVGLAADSSPLLDAAATIGHSATSNRCLDVAIRLGGGALPKEAANLLEHPKPALRVSVGHRLRDTLTTAHLPELHRIASSGRDADARRRAVDLLAYRPLEESLTTLQAALADSSAKVALAAARVLAGDGAPAQAERIRGLFLDETSDPQRGYLLYALLLQMERRGLLLVTDAMEPPLLDAMHSTDTFVAGTAAACLAEWGFRSDRIEGMDYLDRDVPHTLVRAVGGVTFYPQYPKLVPLAELALEHITGMEFGPVGRRTWVSWWSENHNGFHAARARIPIEPADYSDLELVWVSNGQERRFLGADRACDFRSGRYLGAERMAGLANMLADIGFLDGGILPGTYGATSAEETESFQVHVGPRSKRVAFRGEEKPDWVARLAATLEQIWDRSAWQALAPRGAEAAYVLSRLDDWETGSVAMREGLWLETVLEALPRLNQEQARIWVERIAQRESLSSIWDDEVAAALLRELSIRRPDKELAEAFLVAALREPSMATLPASLEAVTVFPEPLRSDLLLRTFSCLGSDAAAQSLDDQRLPVRVAAARSLGDAGDEGVEPLLGALRTQDVAVLQASVRSLGQIGDRAALVEVLQFALPGILVDLRREAILALGAMEDDRALDVLVMAARDENPRIQIAAIQSLARIPGLRVLNALAVLYPELADGPLASIFLMALDDRGAAATRTLLRSHLQSPGPTVRRAAAVHLGALGDPLSVPVLIELLPAEPHDPALLAALSGATCFDFRDTPDPAGVYLAWWGEHAELRGEYWLAEAAAAAGLSLPDRFLASDATADASVVADLLRLLESGPASVRAASAYHLHRLTGIDTPALRRSASGGAIRAAASAWHRWLEDQQNG